MQNPKPLAEQAGLSLTWSQVPKTGFFLTRLICPKDGDRLANSVDPD